MSFAATIAGRRRRRNAVIVTDFTAVDLVWEDGPPTLNAIGATAYSRAVARNAAHQIIPQANQPTITYSSLSTSVATVDSTGLVTAVANGTATIQAASTGLASITQTATVSQVVASISGPTTFSTNDLASGTSAWATYTPKDANGNTVASATLTYGPSDANSIFQVTNSGTGAWAGQGPGTAHVPVSSGAVSITVTITVAHVTYTLTVTPNPVTGSSGGTVQLTVMEDTGSGPVDVTADSGTVYSIADTSKATVDAPTLTSISPTSITQGTSGSYTFTGTNIKGNETIAGLPSGVTASSYSYTSTTVVCTLTATAGATTGGASVSLLASGRGQSGTQTLTVSSGGTPAGTPRSLLYLRSAAATTAPSGTLSTTLPLASHYGAGGWLQLNTANGTSGSNLNVTTTGGASTQSAYFGGWIYATALSTQTIASGTYTLKCGTYSENSSAYKLAPVLSVWRNGVGRVGTIYDSATGIGTATSGPSYTTAGRIVTFTGASVSATSGDFLVLEVYLVGTNSNIVHFMFDSTNTITADGQDCSTFAKAELDFPASIYFGG